MKQGEHETISLQALFICLCVCVLACAFSSLVLLTSNKMYHEIGQFKHLFALPCDKSLVCIIPCHLSLSHLHRYPCPLYPSHATHHATCDFVDVMASLPYSSILVLRRLRINAVHLIIIIHTISKVHINCIESCRVEIPKKINPKT